MPRMPRAQTQNAQQPASLTRNSQTMPPPTQQQQQQQQQRQPAAQPTPEPNNTTAALVPRRNRRGDGTKRSSARLLCTQLVGKDVIARASGTRLGNVSALFVDTEAWRVKALDLRRDVLSGERATVMLPSLRQVGDVALVNDASAAVGAGSGAANSALYGLQSLIGCEVVTDDGYPLGKVSDFVFDPASGDVLSIRYNSVGVSWLPTGAVSTYEISEEELSHYAIPKTVVVRAMADSRAEQLTVGLLGRLGLEGSVWEEEEAEAVAAAMQMQQRQQRQLAATSSYRPAPQRYDYDAYAQQQQQQQMAAPAPPPPQQEQARAPPAPPRPSASEWFADDGGNGMRELEEIYAEEQMYGSEQPPPPAQQRPPRR